MRRLVLAVAGAAVVAGCVQSPSSDSALAARVAELEAREEIRQLLYDYGRYLDASDYAGYAALFSQDGEWIGGMGGFQGPAAIEAMLEEFMPPPAEYGDAKSLHLLSNAQIEVAGDAATAWSRWQFIMPGDNGRPILFFSGVYVDDLVREDGVWKFKRRVAYGEIPFDDPLAEED